MGLVYYALGGGHGHVLRGLAVLGSLGRGTLLGPARLAHWARARGVSYLSAPEGNLAEWLRARPAPELLVVDVFPRGVGGELAGLLERAPAWLVARGVRPDYYLHPPVREALESRFERAVWCEPPPAELSVLRLPSLVLPPILLDVEPLSRDDARAALGAGRGRPLVLGIGSGEADGQARLCRLLGKIASRLGAELRFVSEELPPGGPVVRLFPASRYLLAADVVVSAGGYHAFHETSALGVPAVFVPQRRRYDDQFARVRGARVARDPVELERTLHALLGVEHGPIRPLGEGARRLAALLEGRVQAGVLGQEQVAAMA